MKHFIFIVLAHTLWFSSLAQDTSAIPELKRLPKNLSPTVYSDSLFALAKKYGDIDAVKAISLYKQVIDTAGKIGYSRLQIKSKNNIGFIKGEQNQLAEAYQYHQAAFKIASRTADSIELSITYNYIGDVYKRLRLQEKAIQYIRKAIVIAERKADTSDLSNFSDRLGHVYMDWAEESNNFRYYYEALKNYKYSLHINEKRKDQLRLSISYINLGNAFMVMYRHGGDKSFLRQSVNFSLKGQSIAFENNLSTEWAINTLNLGEAYYLMESYEKSMNYYSQCLPVFERLNKRLWCAATLVDMGLVCGKRKEFDKAVALINRANKITLEYDHAEPYQNYQHLAELYAEKKDYKAAYEATKKYHELYDHDLNTRTMLEMEGKQLELDNERKDKAIELLNEENKYNAVQHKKDIIVNYALFIFSFLLIMVLALLYNRTRLLRRSKELADHARLMQQQFLANTSHEIRTPMNGIIGMAHQLEHTALTPDQQSSLDLIKKSAYNLLGIIDDVLDLSKIQAGRIELHERAFSLEDFLGDIKRLLQGQAREKDLELSFHIDPQLPQFLVGDDKRLRQVLINLLSNAIKFTHKGSVQLKLSVDKKTDTLMYIRFAVIDTGIGIPSRKTSEIFESFVQLENAGQRTQGGTGLGLAITKSLVELQGGTIRVKSKVGMGSTFECIIPFKLSAASIVVQEEPIPATIPETEKKLTGVSILVVEDNPVNQQVIAKILDRWQADYQIAALAVEAFELLGERSFDIILMDIELPGINGWQATEYIRTKFREPVKSTPILAVTAYAYDSEKEKCIRSGMNDVVIKPYSEDELYLKIRSLLYNEDYVAPAVKKNNIEELESRYSNDLQALKELYELFLLEMPGYISELRSLATFEEPYEIPKLAHKMKSPVSLFGEERTIEHLRILNANKDLGEEKRLALMHSIIEDCEQLIVLVNTKLEKLNA